MKFMRQLTFVGLSLILSVCLFTVSPALARIRTVCDAFDTR